MRSLMMKKQINVKVQLWATPLYPHPLQINNTLVDMKLKERIMPSYFREGYIFQTTRTISDTFSSIKYIISHPLLTTSIQELLSMDHLFQLYRVKPLGSDLNTLHRSLEYPYHHLSYSNSHQTVLEQIHYFSRGTHIY